MHTYDQAALQAIEIMKLGKTGPHDQNAYQAALALGQWIVLDQENLSSTARTYAFEVQEQCGINNILTSRVQYIETLLSTTFETSNRTLQQKRFCEVIKRRMEIWFASKGMQHTLSKTDDPRTSSFDRTLSNLGSKLAATESASYVKKLRMHFVSRKVSQTDLPWFLGRWLEDALEQQQSAAYRDEQWQNIE